MSQLTGKEIIERGIVTGYCDEGIQQQGIDVRIKNIKTLYGPGVIPAKGKTKLPETSPVELNNGQWILPAGYYEVDLVEGINMPNDAALYFKTRSSLVRCGAIVESGQFDAGFNTSAAGCFLDVKRTIVIEPGARIAQAIVHTSNPVDNVYDGQFQGDKQR